MSLFLFFVFVLVLVPADVLVLVSIVVAVVGAKRYKSHCVPLYSGEHCSKPSSSTGWLVRTLTMVDYDISLTIHDNALFSCIAG